MLIAEQKNSRRNRRLNEQIRVEMNITWKLPWIVFVEIDLGDDRHRQRSGGGLLLEVVNHQLLVGRVEAEARRQPWLVVAAARAGALHGSDFRGGGGQKKLIF